MPSLVYVTDLRATYKNNLLKQLDRMLIKAGLKKRVSPNDLTAIKLHFGETGNTAFVQPVFLRQITASIKAVGGYPFLTDTNTLYAGTRSNTISHMQTAFQNGFAFSVVGAPVVIADGLRGKSDVEIPIQGKRFSTVYIANDIIAADAMVAVSHFKGHGLAGFGGALKNIGMGCAGRRGKLAQHSNVSPKIKRKKCVGCGDCVKHCAHGALSLENEKAVLDPDSCVGCGECIAVCPQRAVSVQWNQSGTAFFENMIEYAAGVMKDKAGRILFVNFIMNVSPGCDCLPTSDAPIVPDIGIAVSADPVALDQASADLVNRQAALAVSCLKTNTAPGEDKFKGLYPKIDWPYQLEYAEKLGLGTRDYEVVKL